ncbi:MAG: serine protease [Planctomycetota bacterium]
MTAWLPMRRFALNLVFYLAAVAAAAQEPGPVVDDEALEQRIEALCRALLEQGKLVPCSKLVSQLAEARSCALPRAAERTVELEPVLLHDHVRRSVRIVGHYYLCTQCDEWHFSGASGFCVGANGAIATCAHVVAADETMREAYLVVADLAGNVWPVESVLAGDVGADVAVVKTAEQDCVPLPMRRSVRVGARVYCLSHPDHQFGFFSEGLVARWFTQRDLAPERVVTPPDVALPKRLWLHVTCEFAKGSSGAPIVDTTGTVVGIAQSTTTVVYDEDAEVVDTQMVFKTAVPARALMDLLPAPTGSTK